MKRLRWTSLAILVVTGLCLPNSVLGGSMEEAKPSPTTYPTNNWDIRISIPGWIAGIKGDAGVHGRSVNIDQSFSDILDDLDFIATLNLEARRNKWLLYADGFYTKVSTSAERNGLQPGVTREANYEQKQFFGDIGFGYAVLECPRARIEACLGTRVNYLKPEVSFAGPLVQFTDSDSEIWADAIIGLRAEYSFANCSALYFKGDVGGFGSDLTYQLEGGFDFTFTKHFYTRVGYRFLSTDFSNDGFLYDVNMHGPQIELGLRF